MYNPPTKAITSNRAIIRNKTECMDIIRASKAPFDGKSAAPEKFLQDGDGRTGRERQVGRQCLRSVG